MSSDLETLLDSQDFLQFFKFIGQEFDKQSVLLFFSHGSLVDCLELVKVVLASHEGWAQVEEEHLSIVSVVSSFDSLDDLEELLGVDFLHDLQL